MRKAGPSLLVALLLASAVAAKPKPRVIVTVVSTLSGARQVTSSTQGLETTRCNYYDTGVYCYTLTIPPSENTYSIQQVYEKVILPDGTHAILWCQLYMRECQTLAAGSYEAEIKKSTVWMHVILTVDNKPKRIKFQIVRNYW